MVSECEPVVPLAPVVRVGQSLQQRGRLERVEGKGALLKREYAIFFFSFSYLVNGALGDVWIWVFLLGDFQERKRPR